MRKNIFLINKVFISDGIIETDTEVFDNEKDREKAWNSLLHFHNNMVIDCFGLDLNHIPDEYCYNWGNTELEFYCQDDPDMHHDYFVKSESTIEVTV